MKLPQDLTLSGLGKCSETKPIIHVATLVQSSTTVLSILSMKPSQSKSNGHVLLLQQWEWLPTWLTPVQLHQQESFVNVSRVDKAKAKVVMHTTIYGSFYVYSQWSVPKTSPLKETSLSVCKDFSKVNSGAQFLREKTSLQKLPEDVFHEAKGLLTCISRVHMDSRNVAGQCKVDSHLSLLQSNCLCRQDVITLTASVTLKIALEGQHWRDMKMNTFQKAFLKILKSQCNFQIKCLKDPNTGKWEVNPKCTEYIRALIIVKIVAKT